MAIETNDTRDFVTEKTVCCECKQNKDSAKGLRYYFGFDKFVCDDCFIIVRDGMKKKQKPTRKQERLDIVGKYISKYL
jgi:hypothetical protein